jgi:hypothetical protein
MFCLLTTTVPLLWFLQGVSVVLGTEEYLELLEKISNKCSARFHLLPLVSNLSLNIDASETRDVEDESSGNLLKEMLAEAEKSISIEGKISRVWNFRCFI